jgi:hypothetical protein
VEFLSSDVNSSVTLGSWNVRAGTVRFCDTYADIPFEKNRKRK